MNDRTTTTEPRTHFVDAADVAKLIRKDLKRNFPGVKFSVRTDKYSGGASIHVGWTDGPTSKAVDAVTSGYAGGRFDGMTDLAYSANSWYCPTHGARMAETYGHGNGLDTTGASRCCSEAGLMHSLANFVFTSRELSPELHARLVAQVEAETGTAYNPHELIGGQYMDTLVYRASVDTTA